MGKSPKETGGPIVDTGPTAGKNRSRNKNGRWRKKRDDSGKSRKKDGCFLSTAACAYKNLPDDCYELSVLRDFRDTYLRSTKEGNAMIEHYYSVASLVAEKLTEDSELDHVWQTICTCVVHIERKEPEKALEKYKAMVCSLERKYLLDVRCCTSGTTFDR